MKKNLLKFFGIIVFIMIIGSFFTGCKQKQICMNCAGSGTAYMETCQYCNGTGRIKI